ncbi:UNVERIFIED_CONTAM: hypothetical protein FKN15_034423 [Acipenser sinensis]
MKHTQKPPHTMSIPPLEDPQSPEVDPLDEEEEEAEVSSLSDPGAGSTELEDVLGIDEKTPWGDRSNVKGQAKFVESEESISGDNEAVQEPPAPPNQTILRLNPRENDVVPPASAMTPMPLQLGQARRICLKKDKGSGSSGKKRRPRPCNRIAQETSTRGPLMGTSSPKPGRV